MLLAAIVINEFMPNPQDEKTEWIEIQNTSSEQVDISGYQIDDEPNAGSKPYKLPAGTIIEATGKIRFSKAQTNIALNNSKQKDQSFADQVRLLDKSGTEIDSITYTETKTDVPIGHITPTSQPTNTPSPILPTSTLIPEPTPKIVFSPTQVPVTIEAVQQTVEPTRSVLAAATQTEESVSKTSSLPKKTKAGWILVGLGLLVIIVSLALTRYTNKQ